jgi:hypothetical protein
MRDPVGPDAGKTAPRRRVPQANLLISAKAVARDPNQFLLFPSIRARRIPVRIEITASMRNFTIGHFTTGSRQ